jgi:hypothetical protein
MKLNCNFFAKHRLPATFRLAKKFGEIDPLWGKNQQKSKCFLLNATACVYFCRPLLLPHKTNWDSELMYSLQSNPTLIKPKNLRLQPIDYKRDHFDLFIT